jgi:hypothetical protein
VAPLHGALHKPSRIAAFQSKRFNLSWSYFNRPLPVALQWFALGLLGLTVFSVLFNVVCYTGFHLGFPFDTPFVAPASLFDDLILYTPNSHLIHTAAYFQVHDLLIYPAPGHIVYWVLSLAGPHVVLAYLVSAAVIAVTALLLFARSLHRSHIGWQSCSAFAAILLLTSFPLAFTLYTGNIELYLWLLVLCGIWAYCSGREGWAVVCFALAGSAKPYPLLFFLLFLRRGHWHRVVQGTGVVVAASVGSLWLIYPNIVVAYHEIALRTSSFVTANILGYKAGLVGYDHAPWSLFKALTSPWIEMHSRTALDVYLTIGLGVTALLWFTRVRRMPRLEQILFLSVAMLILPPISNDYTLLHLYAPFGLLVLAIAREQVQPRLYVPWLICFAVLFAPESFVIAVSTHFAGQMKCVFLLAIFVTTAVAGRLLPDSGSSMPTIDRDERSKRLDRNLSASR